MINRRSFLTSLGAGAAATLLQRPLASLTAGATNRPPNIIFVLTDDQGYGDLSCHGNPILKTPNLDRLHGESICLSDFQVSPVCSPSRCALMTGRHEFRSGVTHTRGPGQRMSLKSTTIAQVLKASGYATGLFGKWHLGLEPEYQPHVRGFDEVHTFLAGMLAEAQPKNASYMDPILLHNGESEKTTGYCTDVFFNLAMDWIKDVKGKSPFFAYIPTSAPHLPPRCPPEYEKMYTDKVGPNMAKYYGTIANIDDNVGRLLARMKEWDLEQDTLLIFMSDNGATGKRDSFFKDEPPPAKLFNAGMAGGKASIREGGTRVPSFWRWPAAFKGGLEVDRLGSNIDLFPTLAEVAGAKVPAELKLDGRSLLPLLKNPKMDWADRFVFIHASNYIGKAAGQKLKGCAVRSNQYRFENDKGLFDIKADPGESHNVADQHPELVAQMRAAYDKWWDEVLPCLEENEKKEGPQKQEGED